jgi:hypothetical protein
MGDRSAVVAWSSLRAGSPDVALATAAVEFGTATPLMKH